MEPVPAQLKKALSYAISSPGQGFLYVALHY